jgi:hypothetical protein
MNLARPCIAAARVADPLGESEPRAATSFDHGRVNVTQDARPRSRNPIGFNLLLSREGHCVTDMLKIGRVIAHRRSGRGGCERLQPARGLQLRSPWSDRPSRRKPACRKRSTAAPPQVPHDDMLRGRRRRSASSFHARQEPTALRGFRQTHADVVRVVGHCGS